MAILIIEMLAVLTMIIFFVVKDLNEETTDFMFNEDFQDNPAAESTARNYQLLILPLVPLLAVKLYMGFRFLQSRGIQKHSGPQGASRRGTV